MAFDCEKCLNSRMIVSENGYHSICALSAKKASDCTFGKKNHFILHPRYREDSGTVPINDLYDEDGREVKTYEIPY